MNKSKMLYLLGLWKDRRLNHATNHPSFAHNVREKYIKLYILQTLIGQIGIIEIVRLCVQIVIRDNSYLYENL